MRILVTVGTTKFDSLISYIDTNMFFNGFSIEFQIANGEYIPKKHPYFTFIDSADITNKYQNTDVIITHAGQGTIFRLLEMKKKFIVVPNLERIDNHQLDIADFVSNNKYALVAYDLTQLESLIKTISTYQFRIFKKDPFFKAGEIINYLCS